MKRLISFVLRKIPRKYIQVFIHIIPKLFAPFYAGNKVECNVCDHTFRKFLPYGRAVNARENALCPNCLSLERHRLMWMFMKERTNFFTDNIKVLHIAPELCFIRRFDELKNVDYITGDIESPMAKVKLDVHAIPFEENTFDVVICNHVLEHVDNDIKAMSELHRVLKPGGWGLMQSPIDPKLTSTYEDPSITDPLEREKHFGQDDHQRMFGLDYAERLQRGGFDVEEVEMAQQMDPEKAERFRILKNETIYYCKKA